MARHRLRTDANERGSAIDLRLTPAGRAEVDARIERLEKLVRLHEATLRMNGANASPVLKRAAAKAVAEYEAALAERAAFAP
ncbi:MAG: hypothetical protein Q8M26_08575 [Pseudolabrys sp.]|nr:hypothetical protein [Pseudolabrys sp.]